MILALEFVNLKLTNTQQAKTTCAYKHAKEKLLKRSAAIWFNKKCKVNHLTSKYIDIKIYGNNKQPHNIVIC
jgi:hypothetical protein